MPPERAVGHGGEVVVGPLDEAAEVVVDPAREEHTSAGEHRAVVALVDCHGITGFRIDRVVVLRVGDGSLQHYRHRHILETLGGDRRLADGVPGQLEVTAVGCQFGPAHMAGGALLTRLSRKRRNGFSRSNHAGSQQQDRQNKTLAVNIDVPEH